MTMNLLERIEKALNDFTSGRASMHVPPIDTDVDMVLADCQSQITALTSQLGSVVAENAAMIDAVKETLAHWAAAEPGEMESMMDKCMPALRIAYCETPATDAFLAEVRAQGVDDFCNLLGSYAKVEPERFNPQFADLYAKIVNRIFSEVMDNPEVYDLATISDWLERESENSRAYADMSIRHHDQIRQGGAE